MKKQSIVNLQNKISEAATNYYTGNATMSDEQFDAMLDKLRELDPTNEYLNKVGWGYVPSNGKGLRIRHSYGTVGSLSKIREFSQLPKYEKYCISAKLDGASCVAYYVNGEFVCAVSRGDGSEGIDVTQKWLKITHKDDIHVPGNFTGGVRGEIVFSEKDWERYKQEVDSNAKFPRNVATGLLMRDDITDELEYISFVTYKIHGYLGNFSVGEYYSDILSALNKFGFTVVPYKVEYTKLYEFDLLEFYDEIKRTYPVDGIVINFGNSYRHNENGLCEYNDIAYKFQAEIKETEVTNIVWDISKNNILVPVIYVKHVELSGAMVGKATGFNYAFIKDNNVGKGSIVKICRSNEVIPYIVDVVTPSEKSNIPEVCPVCGKPLVVDGVELVCKNAECPNISYSLSVAWLTHIGVRGFLGIGPGFIDWVILMLQTQLKQSNATPELVQRVCDPEVRHNLFGNASETVNKYLDVIARNLSGVPISVKEFILACNLRGVGGVIADKVSEYVRAAVQGDYNTEICKITKINGIGESVLNTFIVNKELVCRLAKLCVFEETAHDETTLKQVTVTGSLSVPRKHFEKVLRENGYKLSDNVKDSVYLITNNPMSGSSKLEKAQKYGVPIISEKEFKEMLFRGK